ncbi:MAG: amino acid adenylation domain-containing protein, partial [Acidobacteria bacterium]|nr:amino acid adenylation domain-containing protein [Acidobacteriota bacterium]
QSFEGNTVDFQLEEKEVQQLKEMASGSSSTLYIVLLSLFNLLLFKLSGQEDIVVGAPVAGRNHADLQQIIGMFVNTLVVRNFPCAEKHFNEFLEEVKQRTLAVYENQDYPFEELVDKVEINRDIARNPVFDVLFVLKNPTQKEKTLDRNIYGYDSRVAKFDMTLFAAEIGEKFSFSLEYCSRLFKKETIERFITYFKNIVSSILLKPSQRLSEVEILTEGEKQRLLLEFNDTTSLYPGLRTICELFEIQVEKSPDHIALVGTCLRGSLVLTYRKLNEKSNHLAWILQEKGVCPDTIVGIMVERSLEIIIGILGILKAGGAYLPIDPSYPEERIEYMLKDSGAKLLAVANDQEGETMRRWEGEKVLLKSICHHSNYFFFQHSASGIPSVQYLNHSNHFAYIIYTSGTTGRPRGAGVYHRGLFNLIHWFVTQFGLNTKDRNLLLTSLSFDLTQKNIFAPLATGGTLSLPAQDYFDPPGILDNVEQKQLTWLNCTPAMIYKIIEYGSEEDLKKLVSLRYVFLGGEPILMKGLKKWTALSYFKARIVNTYGPTECADISTSYSIEEPVKFYEKNVPMGKPIYNVNLYILDRWFQLLPVGVPGELFIGGEGVGAGYLNRPELTYEKFILEKSLPVGNRRKFYKTGDLTCWLADGNIDFLGRIDLQVKIRGFRIEMGEIEAQLLKNDSLKEVVVLDRTEENGEKYLCAYIVMAKGLQLDLVDIKQYLSRHLPDYMIPSYFIPVEKIPLTANGKVDRKALPETGIKRSNEYEAPANEIEDKLIVIWSEVLAIEKDKIGRNDNFFQLGGHSLNRFLI